MKINRDNYEEFFIDYHDGNLAPEGIATLLLFLEANPDLKAEFENYYEVKLQAPEVFFEGKEELLRGTITLKNYEQHVIAEMEGDLSPSEQLQLRQFLRANPQLEKEAALFHATRLSPDLSETFPGKNDLKKPVPFTASRRKYIYTAIAAAILLFVISGTFMMVERTIEQPPETIAEKQATGSVRNADSKANHLNTNSGNINKRPSSPVADPARKDVTSSAQAKLSPPKQLTVPKIAPAEIKPATTGTVQLVATLSSPPISQEALMQQVALKKFTVPAFGPVSSPGDEQYLTIWEALRKASDNNLKKIINKESEETLAFADQPADRPVRLTDLIGRGIEKLSNDKVTLETGYNEAGDVNNIRFSAGAFKIEKTSAK